MSDGTIREDGGQAELFPEEEARLPAFFLSLLYLAVYAGCFRALNTPLNHLTARFPPLLGIFTRILLPSSLGTALCALIWLAVPGTRRLMTAAYRWLLFLALALFTALQILLWGERSAQLMVIHFFGHFALCPVLSGLYLSRRLPLWERRREERRKRAPSRQPPPRRSITRPLSPRQTRSGQWRNVRPNPEQGKPRTRPLGGGRPGRRR